MTEPDEDYTQDELPDFVDRFLGLPADQQGTPDCQKTVAWLAAEVLRLSGEFVQSNQEARRLAARADDLERVASTATAALRARDSELQAVTLEARNFGELKRRIHAGRLKIIRAGRRRPREIGLEEWPAILMFAGLCRTDAEAARRLAGMQWEAANPLRPRVDRSELKRLGTNWKTKISRARDQLPLPTGTPAGAVEEGRGIHAEMNTTLLRVIERLAALG